MKMIYLVDIIVVDAVGIGIKSIFLLVLNICLIAVDFRTRCNQWWWSRRRRRESWNWWSYVSGLNAKIKREKKRR